MDQTDEFAASLLIVRLAAKRLSEALGHEKMYSAIYINSAVPGAFVGWWNE
jgi:hypothetical protein